jgi:D-3-phosphoglycerate dehydrogenase
MTKAGALMPRLIAAGRGGFYRRRFWSKQALVPRIMDAALPSLLSKPRETISILLLEGISESAVDLLKQAGYTKVTRLTKALEGDDLVAALQSAHILGIRSRTQLTADIFARAPRLVTVGCFSVGTNQVDLDAARRGGIPVFNAPFSNTRSVAELVIGEIVMLLRRIVPRSVAAHAGGWDKSAENSYEVRGKTLGIVGYGNIGSQLSNLAEAMGMRVIFHDLTDKLRHGNTEPVETLDELLAQSDVVSLHVPETPATHNMIGAEEIARMKPGAYFINNSRGTVVDLEALAAGLRSGHLRGAAVDVFPVEPTSNKESFVSPLQGIPNVILTPHIGGSTGEAQERIGTEVARRLVEYSDVGSTLGAVNFPQVQLPTSHVGTRFIHIHDNVPGMMNRMNDVFSRRGWNIAAQYLQTSSDVGYVVVDADSPVPLATQACAEAAGVVLADLRKLEGTIRARVLY